MLPKRRSYVKCYDGSAKWTYFLLKMMAYLEKQYYLG